MANKCIYIFINLGIVNYTRRLDCGSGHDAFQKDEALKFLTHFMGDITQRNYDFRFLFFSSFLSL